MRKKLIKNAFLMVSIIFITMLCPNQAKAEETTPTTSEYTLSADGTPMQATMDTNSKTTVIFSFKVDHVSNLEINLSTTNTGCSGSVKAGVFEDKLGSKCIYTGNYTDLPEDEPVTIHTSLEPGTYYIIYIRNIKYNALKGTVTTSVKTLNEIKDKMPTTFDKPLTLKSDVTYKGIISSNGKGKLYFKLKLQKKATVHVFTSAESAYPTIKQFPYKVVILNKDEVEKASKQLSGVDKIEESTFNLSKGTYYICVNVSKTYYVGDVSVKARINYKK